MGGRRVKAAWIVVGVLFAASAGAVAPRTEPVETIAPPHPLLLQRPAEPLNPNHSRFEKARRDFLAAQPDWTVELDSLTGRPHRGLARGPGLAFVATPLDGGPSGAARQTALEQAARAFLAQHADLFLVNDRALVLDAAGSVSVGEGALDVLRLDLQSNGVPVLGGGVTLAARHGRLVYVATSHLAPETVVSRPVLSAADALNAALAYGAVNAVQVQLEDSGSLLLLPGLEQDGSYVWRPIYRVRWSEAAGSHRWEAWVDGLSGELHAFYDRVVAACEGPPDGATARVSGGIRPALGTDPEVVRPLRSLHVEPWGVTTDGGGRYVPGFGDGYSTLYGDHAWITCVGCTDPVAPYAVAEASGDISFGTNQPGDQDQDGNGLSTLAGRSAYSHVGAAHQTASDWLQGMTFLDRSFELQVNFPSACNALYTGFAIRFYRSDEECRNTGEIRDVVVHEWGHALDDFDGVSLADYAYAEGVADVLAMIIDHDSCIAESLYQDFMLPGPSARCGGIRDLDETAPGLRHDPAVMRLDDNDCGSEVHCLGEIYGQTAWHLAHGLVHGVSLADGQPVGPALGELAGWREFERLYFLSRPLAETMDPNAVGVSAYDATIVADTLPSGIRPHVEAINEAFDHHGLAPGSPEPVGEICPPVSDPPVLSATPALDANGREVVEVRFEPNGAAAYRVLRRNPDEALFRPLDGVLQSGGPGSLMLVDDTVALGLEYEYAVQAVDADGDGCSSPGANRVAVTVVLPDLVVASVEALDPPPAGNGDGGPGPGEWVGLDVAVREASGLAGAQGVLGSLVSLDSQVSVLNWLDVDYGPVGPGQTAEAEWPFIVRVDATRDCHLDIPFVVGFESEMGCRYARLPVPMGPEACPEGGRPELLAIDLSVVDDTLLPECTDGDGFPDSGERVRLRVQAVNRGEAPASMVGFKVTAGDPRVLMVGGGIQQVMQEVLPGETVEGEVEAVIGDLDCSTQLDFDVLVSAPESAPPESVGFVLDAEVDVAVGELVFDFETDEQGWTATGAWSRSDTRSNPDDSGWSFYSGSEPNQCDRLTSPPLTLHPAGDPSLRLSSWYQFFRMFQGKWWDGALVYVLGDWGETPIEPVSGRLYDGRLFEGIGCEADMLAWVRDRTGLSWAESVFDLSPFRGQTIRIQIRVTTDNRDTDEGIYVDDIVVSGVATT
jgi:hypothetical protein